MKVHNMKESKKGNGTYTKWDKQKINSTLQCLVPNISYHININDENVPIESLRVYLETTLTKCYSEYTL